jgi:hypothetical protein
LQILIWKFRSFWAGGDRQKTPGWEQLTLR